MRELMAKTIAVLGVISAFAVAGLWAYFVWTNDWGHLGTRGRGLWLMGLTTGTILVFIGSPWNRVGKLEGLRPSAASVFGDISHFRLRRNLPQMSDGKSIEASSAHLGHVFI